MLHFKKKLLYPAFPPWSLLYALRYYSYSYAGWNNLWNRPVWSRNLKGRTEKYMDTPFGKASDVRIWGKIKNVDCIFLARHGRQHTILPSKVNYQVNIWALKEEGCTHVIVITAWGSLREDIQSSDTIIIDQFINSLASGEHDYHSHYHYPPHFFPTNGAVFWLNKMIDIKNSK